MPVLWMCARHKQGVDLGGRPVFYEKTAAAKKILLDSEHWRIVNLNIQIAAPSLIDWTHDREWRLPNNFTFARNLCHVLLYDKQGWDYFLEFCPADILKERNHRP